MLSKVVLREIKRVAICTVVLTAIMLVVFALAGYFDTAALYGAILGYAVNIINFIIMSISVELSLSKSKAKASSMMGISYFARLALIALAVYWAIKSPYFNYVATIIPLIFTRISIYILNFADSRKRGEQA